LMYTNGTHQDTIKIHAGYIKIHQDTYCIGNPPNLYRKPPVTRVGGSRPQCGREPPQCGRFCLTLWGFSLTMWGSPPLTVRGFPHTTPHSVTCSVTLSRRAPRAVNIALEGTFRVSKEFVHELMWACADMSYDGALCESARECRMRHHDHHNVIVFPHCRILLLFCRQATFFP
jgi:hypothetical protein